MGGKSRICRCDGTCYRSRGSSNARQMASSTEILSRVNFLSPLESCILQFHKKAENSRSLKPQCYHTIPFKLLVNQVGPVKRRALRSHLRLSYNEHSLVTRMTHT